MQIATGEKYFFMKMLPRTEKSDAVTLVTAPLFGSIGKYLSDRETMALYTEAPFSTIS